MALLLAEEPPKYLGKNLAKNLAKNLEKNRGKHRGRHGGGDIPEKLLARLWRQRAARQAWFRTASGSRIRVLYPGRQGGGAGPDFREALLEVEGQGLVRGDVELHVEQRDWKSHGHSGDPNYNGVVLHAVLGVESVSTGLHNGAEVPVVSLAPLLEGGQNQGSGTESKDEEGVSAYLWDLLASWGYIRPESMQEAGCLLDRAGDQRFQAKSRSYAGLLDETGRQGEALEQALYEALMEGLGYKGNQQGFLGLAQRAPWGRLVERSGSMDREQGQAAVREWLSRVSGLVSVPAPAGRLPRGLGPALAAGDWKLSGLRPANHPLRRMAGAAAWVQRFRDSGLASGLRKACVSGQPAELAKALQVSGPDGSRAHSTGAYIGRDRARDIAVNVALPILQASDNPGPDSEYQALYRRFGKLQENELTKEMSRRLLPAPWRSAADSARRQQGLLHLQRLLAGES